MSENDKVLKIDRLDFGMSLKNKGVKKGLFSFKKLNVKLSPSDFFKLLVTSKSKLFRFFKYSSNLVGRAKWSFSRSIFFGRGIYFKYISNLALLLIVSFGAFVYLGYDKGSNGFISRYAGVSASSSGALFNPGGQSVIAQKQFRVTQYTVQPGDTLSTIASKYSTEENVITVDSILWANGLKSNVVLRPGTRLDIPPVSGVLHVVKKGDTVISVAKKYKLINDKSSGSEVEGATQQITDLNLLDVRVVQANGVETKVPELVEGQRIIVPGGVIIDETPKVAVVNRVPSTGSVPPVIAVPGQTFVFMTYDGSGSLSNPYSSWHKAIDITDDPGSIRPYLVAIADGVVEFAGLSNICGYNVRIKYANGFSSMFCHITKGTIVVSAGQRVVQGQVVGRMGDTGFATGVHVHFELKINGVNVNPCSYQPFASRCVKKR